MITGKDKKCIVKMLPGQTGQHSPASITGFVQLGGAHSNKHIIGRGVRPTYCPLPTADNPNKSIIDIKEFMFYVLKDK
jgi:hypothetical protein